MATESEVIGKYSKSIGSNGKLSPLELLGKCEHPIEKRRGAFCGVCRLQIRVIGYPRRKRQNGRLTPTIQPVEKLTGDVYVCCENMYLKLHDSDIVCESCGAVQSRDMIIPEDDDLVTGAAKFGRTPNNSVVMDNNLGTAPGPERKKQAMSALNSAGESKKEGLEFHVGMLDILTLMKMSGDPTDHKVSEILSRMIRAVQKERNHVIPEERVSFLAQAVKIGIKEAEKSQRLTSRQMKFCAERAFMKEKLWPP